MKGDEVHSAQFFEGKEECFISYSLPELWELMITSASDAAHTKGAKENNRTTNDRRKTK